MQIINKDHLCNIIHYVCMLDGYLYFIISFYKMITQISLLIEIILYLIIIR